MTVRIPNCGLLPEDIEAAIALAAPPPFDVACAVRRSPAQSEHPSQLDRAIRLLEILGEELQSVHGGPHACREIELAIERIDEARHWLGQRKLSSAI
jgi:hypothetical protein